jgi:hypothetical protein
MSTSNPYEYDLAAIASNYRQRCFNYPYDDCRASVKHVSSNLQLHKSIKNFMIVTCQLCTRTWFVCVLCQGQQQPLLTEKSSNKHVLNLHTTPKTKRKVPSISPSKTSTVKTKRKAPPVAAAKASTKSAAQSPSTLSIASPPRRNPARVRRANFPSKIQNTSSVALPRNDFSSPNNMDLHFGDDYNNSPEEVSFFPKSDLFRQYYNSAKSSLSEYSSFSATKSSDELYYKYNFRSALYYCNVDNNHEEASAQLIAKALNFNISSAKQLSSEEIKQQMLLAKLSRSLTKTQLTDLSMYLQSITKTHIAHNNQVLALCKNVPTRVSDFRRLFLDGKSSISQNVPKSVSQMLQFHLYVSVTYCLANLFAHNTIPICNVQQVKEYNVGRKHKYNNIYNSPSVKTVLDNIQSRLQDNQNMMKFSVVPVLLYIWSDNFNPIKSIKMNRQSVLIITCTISVLLDEFEVMQHTYPLAVGRKGCDHTEVMNLIFQEMKLLSSGPFSIMYSTGNKYPVYVHADIVAVMSDQLERRSNLKLGAGNHRYHCRFGYSCNMESVFPFIHACSNCSRLNKKLTLEFMEEIVLSDESIRQQRDKCTFCTNWFTCDDSNLLLYKPDDDFPKPRLINQQYIMAHKLTFDSLLNATKYVHNGIVGMYLSKSEAFSYLGSFCFNNKTIEQIYDCANNCLILNNVTTMHESNNNEDNAYEKKCPAEAKTARSVPDVQNAGVHASLVYENRSICRSTYAQSVFRNLQNLLH